jgi:hypothetical protein
MWWLRFVVQCHGGNSRLRILGSGARTGDCMPFQPIDFTEILAQAVLVDLGRRLQAWSDLLYGMSIAFVEYRGDQVNRDAEDHGCRIIKDCNNSSGRRPDNGSLGRGATLSMQCAYLPRRCSAVPRAGGHLIRRRGGDRAPQGTAEPRRRSDPPDAVFGRTTQRWDLISRILGPQKNARRSRKGYSLSEPRLITD